MRRIVGKFGVDGDVVSKPEAHEPDVVLYEFYLLGQARHLFVAVVQNNPHKLRQFHDACLGLLGIYVDESVDIIKGVHEEVRIYLPLQVVKPLLQVLLFQLFQFLPVISRLEVCFCSDVHAEQE